MFQPANPSGSVRLRTEEVSTERDEAALAVVISAAEATRQSMEMMMSFMMREEDPGGWMKERIQEVEGKDWKTSNPRPVNP